MAYSNARLQYNELDCQVILVSALFQDIGNIFTLIFNQHKADKYRNDANLNFAILAEPLAKLANDGHCSTSLYNTNAYPQRQQKK